MCNDGRKEQANSSQGWIHSEGAHIEDKQKGKRRLGRIFDEGIEDDSTLIYFYLYG